MTSPQRLIGLLVVLAYYFNFLFRPFGTRDQMPRPPGTMPLLEFPRVEVIDGIVFGIFAMISLFLMMGALTPRGGFRQADVDVLFPTPVNPKIVLVFRLAREYFFTLLFPLLIAVLSGRAGVSVMQTLFRGHETANVSGGNLMLAWFLLSFMWVCIGFGLSMFVNRSDERSDLNKKVINAVIFGSLIVAVLFIGFKLKADPTLDTALELSHHPLLRAIFFGATFATQMVAGPLQGLQWLPLVGGASLIGLSTLGIWLAMTQAGYMYDQAAAKGFDSVNLRKLQRSGDTYGMVAEQARLGKVKKGRVAGWVSRQKMTGGSALLWKEMLLQTRGAMWQYYLMGPMVLLLVLMPLYGLAHRDRISAEVPMLLTFQALGVFIITLNNATSGFIELLRRVDVQKPLPFTPSAIVFWEILAKCIPTSIVATIASAGAIIIDSRLWAAAIACVVLMPTVAMILTSVVLLVTILFPDVDDAAQRSFRGLMMLLGCVIVSLPGVAIMGVLLYLKVNPLIAALPIVGLNIGITGAVAAMAGGLYAGFNPSE
ncbi:MAG: putative ABC exporter domain-containing protein [Fimbriimonas sp.]